MACPDENELVELIEGRLAGPAGEALDTHIDGCESCRRLVSAFAGEPTGATSSSSSLELPAATLIAGRYQLEDVLGTGAMSIVYAAHDRTLDRRIALKLLRDSGAPDAHDRLRREAQVMARLADPHVLPVHDVGTFEGRVFLTTELVPGGTLAERIGEGKALPWTAAVELFVQAGRGLAAAHRAGIVHRDFKPSNVLVGEEGRVRVADFGLARRGAVGEASVSPLPPGSPLALTLTRSDEIVGTPAYLAPELWEGGDADARSDQFAFAVALYETVHGRRLFDATTIEGFADQVTSTDAPRGAVRLPARLERAIHKGLARQPKLRFATMDAFVAELERIRGGARRRRLVIAAIALAGVVGGGAAIATRLGAGGPPCATAGGALATAWDPVARQAVERAFLASGHPDAAAAFGKVAEAFDAYAARWRAAQVDACEATHVAHVQSAAVLDARTGCLDTRRADAVALIGALGGPIDKVGVGRAVSAARGLPRIEDCADVRALGEIAPAPATAAAEVAAIRTELGRANAEERLGKYKEALAIAGPLAARAEAIGYAPLTASVLFARGRLEGALTDNVRARATLEEAARAAAAGRDDVLAARIWSQLVEVVAFRMGKRDEGVALAQTAEASLLRAGSPPLWVGNLERLRALVLRDQAKYAEARTVLERALGRFREVLAPDDALIAGAIHDLAELDRATGKLDEAKARHEEALAMREKVLGPASPVTAMSHANLGSVYYARGELAEARKHFARALEIDERSLAPDSAEMGNVLTLMGAVEMADGHLPEARALFERATTAYATSLGADHVRIGMVENNLGEVARREKKPDEAMRHYERSIAIKEPKLGRRHPEIAATLSNLGDLATQSKQPDKARAYYLESLSIFEEKVGPDAYQVVFPLKGLAQLAIDAHDDRRAVHFLERIIAIREHDKAAESDLALYRSELAKVKQRQGSKR